MSNRYLPPEPRCPTVIFMNGRDWQCARIDGHAPDGFGPDTPWVVVGRGCRTFTQPDPGALDAWWEMHRAATEQATAAGGGDALQTADSTVESVVRERVLQDA